MLSIITLLAWLENRVDGLLNREDKGEVSIEFVLVAGLAAVAIIAGMAVLFPAAGDAFDDIAAKVTGAF